MAETTTRKPAAKKAAPTPEPPVMVEAAPEQLDQPRNVIEAIVAVMRDVTHVGKDGRNTQHNYNFRGIDGTVNALAPAMRRHGLLVTPRLVTFEYGEIVVGQNRTKQAHAQVQVEYTFHYSNAAGEMTHLTAYVPGEAMDSGDKGTAKAMSVAFRIALLQTFALPTDEPDADHSSVTRGQAVAVPTAAEVQGACQWAAEQEDFETSFSYLHQRFADGLGQVTLSTKTGETLLGDEYVEHARELVRAARAAKVREEQDAAAYGDTSEVAPAAQAPAVEQEPARAAEPTTAPAAAAPEAPKETRAERNMRIVRDELAFQADALGVPFDQWAQGASDDKGLVFGKAAKHITSNRPNVIAAMQQAGRASEAAAYAKVADGFPIELHIIFESLDREDRHA